MASAHQWGRSVVWRYPHPQSVVTSAGVSATLEPGQTYTGRGQHSYLVELEPGRYRIAVVAKLDVRNRSGEREALYIHGEEVTIEVR
jgi:hypothetical protein